MGTGLGLLPAILSGWDSTAARLRLVEATSLIANIDFELI